MKGFSWWFLAIGLVVVVGLGFLALLLFMVGGYRVRKGRG